MNRLDPSSTLNAALTALDAAQARKGWRVNWEALGACLGSTCISALLVWLLSIAIFGN